MPIHRHTGDGNPPEALKRSEVIQHLADATVDEMLTWVAGILDDPTTHVAVLAAIYEGVTESRSYAETTTAALAAVKGALGLSGESDELDHGPVKRVRARRVTDETTDW